MLANTDRELLDLKTSFEKRLADGEESHPQRNNEACKSLHHARLLLGIRQREMIMEIAKAQEAAKMSTLRGSQGGLAATISTFIYQSTNRVEYYNLDPAKQSLLGSRIVASDFPSL